MSELPPEIITTILARLPVKSLLRFRCVSKPWRSLIDGQDFTKLHLHQSAETNTNRTLIMKSAHRLIPDVLDSLEQLDIGNNRFPNFLLVNGSCNGLVLLSTAITSDKLFLWNPSTRKVNVLLLHALPPLEAGFWTRRCGLGYDSKHDDYKVVCMDQDVDNRSNDGRLFSETTIYSLKTNSWKKAAVDFPYDKRHCRSWDVYVNDALHCVVDSSFFCAEEMIMAFDLAKEEYNVVPKPESAAGRVGLCLASVGGRLVVVVDKREFWVMKEYGVKGSWCKLANCFDDPGEGCVSLRSLAFSESWIEGLFNKNEGTRLDWYRLGKNKTVTVAYVEGSSSLLDVDVVLGSSFGARVCVASLVSPFSPSI